MNTPAHLSDAQLEALVERGLLPAAPYPPVAPTTSPDHVEHPTSSWLYRKFKKGSAVLSKDEAYSIGNQLDEFATRSRGAGLIATLSSLTREQRLDLVERLGPCQVAVDFLAVLDALSELNR